MFVAYMISNVIPFFDSLIALIGSFCTALLAFLFPVVLYFRCGVMYSLRIRGIEKALMYFIIIFSILLAIFGTIANLRKVLAETKVYGEPFECHCKSKNCILS